MFGFLLFGPLMAYSRQNKSQLYSIIPICHLLHSREMLWTFSRSEVSLSYKDSYLVCQTLEHLPKLVELDPLWSFAPASGTECSDTNGKIWNTQNSKKNEITTNISHLTEIIGEAEWSKASAATANEIWLMLSFAWTIQQNAMIWMLHSPFNKVLLFWYWLYINKIRKNPLDACFEAI